MILDFIKPHPRLQSLMRRPYETMTKEEIQEYRQYQREFIQRMDRALFLMDAIPIALLFLTVIGIFAFYTYH